MPVISVTGFKNSLLNPDFNQVRNIEIKNKPFAEGGFGAIYSCLSIDGKKPQIPQVIKIFRDDGTGNHVTGYETIQKLQDKIIVKNQDLKQKGQITIEKIPALYALPQFSYEGTFNGQHILGYSANRLDTANEYVEFDKLLQDQNLQHQYYGLALKQKLQYALDLVDGVKILREMSFIHADINDQNLFINLKTGGHLVIIDYDSGAVTENPSDSPTTWGKPNEWVAPEIAKQLLQHQQGLPTVKVNLFTDTWSVTVGIHYLIFLRHPLFYLNRLGMREMQDYFNQHKWPGANKNSSNFNRSTIQTYDKIKNILNNTPQLSGIKKRLDVTINEGFYNPSRRTSYGQWVSTIRSALFPPPKPHVAPSPPARIRRPTPAAPSPPPAKVPSPVSALKPPSPTIQTPNPSPKPALPLSNPIPIQQAGVGGTAQTSINIPQQSSSVPQRSMSFLALLGTGVATLTVLIVITSFIFGGSRSSSSPATAIPLDTSTPTPTQPTTKMSVPTSALSTVPRSMDSVRFFINGVAVDDLSKPYSVNARELRIKVEVRDSDGLIIPYQELSCEWEFRPSLQTEAIEEENGCQITYQASDGADAQLFIAEIKGQPDSTIIGVVTKPVDIILP